MDNIDVLVNKYQQIKDSIYNNSMSFFWGKYTRDIDVLIMRETCAVMVYDGLPDNTICIICSRLKPVYEFCPNKERLFKDFNAETYLQTSEAKKIRRTGVLPYKSCFVSQY